MTGPNGGMLYLGGSFHGLLSTDYPLPSAYNRAFDGCTRLVTEDDPKVSPNKFKGFLKSGEYQKNDNLKNHVDPRVYDYLRRVFALWNVREADFSKFRPWSLVMWVFSTASNQLGVESYLTKRAQANRIPISGLESFREHMEIISGLNDYQAQLVLLTVFIPSAPGTDERKTLMNAWRRGDADTISRADQKTFHDLPSFYQRLVVDRNHNWIPKIEHYLAGRETCFVVVGAAHMGGQNGVLALLRARGCKIEEL